MQSLQAVFINAGLLQSKCYSIFFIPREQWCTTAHSQHLAQKMLYLNIATAARAPQLDTICPRRFKILLRIRSLFSCLRVVCLYNSLQYHLLLSDIAGQSFYIRGYGWN